MCSSDLSYAKPLAKLAVIRQRTPDPRNRGLQFNALLNSVIHLKQPPGCTLVQGEPKSNPMVAFSSAASTENHLPRRHREHGVRTFCRISSVASVPPWLIFNFYGHRLGLLPFIKLKQDPAVTTCSPSSMTSRIAGCIEPLSGGQEWQT